jgi:ribosomal protein L33
MITRIPKYASRKKEESLYQNERLAISSKISTLASTMAKQVNLVKLVHKATGHVYWTRKNKKKLANVKLKLNKFNPVLRKTVEYTESKK